MRPGTARGGNPGRCASARVGARRPCLPGFVKVDVRFQLFAVHVRTAGVGRFESFANGQMRPLSAFWPSCSRTSGVEGGAVIHTVTLWNESEYSAQRRHGRFSAVPRRHGDASYSRSQTMNLGGCIPNIIGSPSPQKERVASGIPIYFQLIIQRGGPVVG